MSWLKASRLFRSPLEGVRQPQLLMKRPRRLQQSAWPLHRSWKRTQKRGLTSRKHKIEATAHCMCER